MKKVSVLLLALTLIVSLCACGAPKVVDTQATEAPADTAAIKANLEKGAAYIESVANTKDMTVNLQNEDPAYLYQTWINNDQNAEDDVALDIVIGDKTFTVGITTLPELREMGFTMESAPEKVDPQTSYSFSINKDKKYADISIDNFTDQAQNADELVVSQVQCTNGPYALEFAYKELTIGSTFEDVLKALGTPRDIISLTADSTGTEIELSYFREAVDGDKATNDNLSLHFAYDVDSNKATMTSINLQHTVMDKPE